MASLREETTGLSVGSETDYGSTRRLLQTDTEGISPGIEEGIAWTNQAVTLSWLGLNAYIIPENNKFWKRNENANPRQILQNGKCWR